MLETGVSFSALRAQGAVHLSTLAEVAFDGLRSYSCALCCTYKVFVCQLCFEIATAFAACEPAVRAFKPLRQPHSTLNKSTHLATAPA